MNHPCHQRAELWEQRDRRKSREVAASERGERVSFKSAAKSLIATSPRWLPRSQLSRNPFSDAI